MTILLTPHLVQSAFNYYEETAMYAAKLPAPKNFAPQLDRARSLTQVDRVLWEIATCLPQPIPKHDFRLAQLNGWNGQSDRLTPALRVKILEAAFQQDLLFRDRYVPLQKPIVTLVYGREQLQAWYRESQQRFPQLELVIAMRPVYSRTEKFIEQTLFWQPQPGCPPLIPHTDLPVAPFWEQWEPLVSPEVWWDDDCCPDYNYVVNPRGTKYPDIWTLDAARVEAIRWSGRYELLGSKLQATISATGQRLLPNRVLFHQACATCGDSALSSQLVIRN
jgi:hypothetical protein